MGSSDSDYDLSVELIGGMVSWRGLPLLWDCSNVLERTVMAEDVIGNVWAQSAVSRDERGRNFYFPWYIVKHEE